MAKLPGNTPGFDGKGFEAPLRDAFPRPDGKPRAVYNGQLPAFTQYVYGLGPYDGTGLVDVVQANALEQNQTNKQVATLRAEVDTIDDRLAALEAQSFAPFPASG